MLLLMLQRSRFLRKQQARLGGTADAPYVLAVEFAEIIGLILSGRCPLRVHAAPCLCACVCVCVQLARPLPIRWSALPRLLSR